MPKAQQQVVQVCKHTLGDCDCNCPSFSPRWTWAANSGKWMRRTCTTSSWKTCPASLRRQRTRVPVWTRERWEHCPDHDDDHVDLCRNSKRGGMATHAGVALELGIIRPAEGKSRWWVVMMMGRSDWALLQDPHVTPDGGYPDLVSVQNQGIWGEDHLSIMFAWKMIEIADLMKKHIGRGKSFMNKY